MTSSSHLLQDRYLRRLLTLAVVVFIAMSLLRPQLFLTSANFSSMAYQFPQLGLLALGILLAMVTGGIDLSMVGIANLSAILAALVLTRWIPPDAGNGQIFWFSLLAVLIDLATGVACGLLNGLVIAKVGVTPILATLGTMQLYTGIAIIITGGTAVFGIPEAFTSAAAAAILGVPVPLLIFACAAVMVAILLNRSPLGVRLYLFGTNPTAARFSGFDIDGLQLRTYALTGLLSAVSGLLVLAQTNSAKADYGTSYTLQSILVAVMGGVNPYGGFGKVSGVVIALLTLQFLSSGFNMLRFSTFLKDFVWGASLLLVIALNYYSDQRRAREAVQMGRSEEASRSAGSAR